MTTVAWDGHVLAADTLATRGAVRSLCERKVFRIVTNLGKLALLGVSGGEGPMMEVMEWVASDRPPELKPKLEPDSFSGILITENGAFRLDSTLYPLKLIEPFHAVGSGREFAIAAMHLGKSAREAVELASVYDIYTGGPIVEITLE